MNIFSSGLDKDSPKLTVGEGSYTDSRNSVLNNTTFNNMFSLANEQGFTAFGDYQIKKPNFLTVGMCNSSDDIVLFSVQVDSSLNVLSSEIGVVELGVYRTVVNDQDGLYWNGAVVNQGSLFNFSLEHQISCETRFDNENNRVVYFIDGYNYNRYINIDKDYTVEKFNNVDIQTRLLDTPEYPICTPVKVLTGGAIRAGVYQFCARYRNSNLDPTEFGYVSNIIPIVDEPEDTVDKTQYDGANFDYPKVSKSIQVRVDNIDINYKFIDVVVIYYSGAASDFNAAVFSSVEITGYSMDFTFTGKVADTILLQDIVQVKPKYKTAQHHTQKDGRYIQANMTVNQTVDVQPIANRLTLKYGIREEEYYITNDDLAKPGFTPAANNPDGDVKLMGDDSTCYKVPLFVYNNTGYMRNEVYSFGIVGSTLEGDGFVAHIPGYYSKDDLNFIQYPDSDSGRIYPKPDQILGTFVSEVLYKERDTYYGRDSLGNIIDLYATGIRHHLMPDFSQEPTFRVDATTGITYIRVLYIEVVGLKNALDLYPEIRNKLKSLTLVRQERDVFENKSVYAQGFANDLLLHNGKIKSGSQVRDHRNNGTNPVTTPPDGADDGDHYSDYGAESEDFATLDNSIPSYTINPLGGVHFHDYNSGCFMMGRIPYEYLDDINGTAPNPFNPPAAADNQTYPPEFFETGFDLNKNNAWSDTTGNSTLGGFSGTLPDRLFFGRRTNAMIQLPPDLRGFSSHSNDVDAKKNVAFYSPETVLLGRDFQIPIGAKLRKVAVVRATPKRLTKTADYLICNRFGTLDEGYRIASTDFHLGHYADLNQFPFSKKMRSAYFHIYSSYCTIVKTYSVLDSNPSKNTILVKQTTVTNDIVKSKEDLIPLITTVPGTNRKLNNYDNEGFTLYSLTNPLLDAEFTPKRLFCVLGCTFEVESGQIFDQLYIYVNSTEVYIPNAQNELYIEDTVYNPQTWFRPDGINLLDPPQYYPGMRPLSNRRVGRDAILGQQVDPPPEPATYDRMLYNTETENKTQYGELNGNKYVPVATFYSDELSIVKPNLNSFYKNSLTQIYGGDTYIGKFAYRSSMRLYHRIYKAYKNQRKDINLEAVEYQPTSPDFPDGGKAEVGNQLQGGHTRITQKDGTELRELNFYIVESQINTEFRHRETQINTDGEITAYGVPYFPKASAIEAIAYESELGQPTAYNILYSKQNNVKPFFGKPFGFVEVDTFPTRIIYSQATVEGEQADQYRIFLTNDYQDIPKHKGQITNVFVFNNTLFAHTERSLFQTNFNRVEMLNTQNTESIFIGTGGIFSSPPVEVYTVLGGYAGSVHKYATVTTPFGIIFVDHNQKKVFSFDGSAITEVTKGLYNFFIKNLNTASNNIINPKGTGLLGVYDPKYKRVLLTIKQAPNTVNLNTKVFEDNEYQTLSYNLESKSWTSLHDYCPALAVTVDNEIYSMKNNPLPGNNSVFKHNSGTPGIYYTEDIYPFIIEFVVNEEAGQSKAYDNMIVQSESYDANFVKQLVEFFDTGEFWNDYQSAGEIPFVVRDPRLTNVDEFLYNCSVFNNQYQIYVPYSKTSDNFLDIHSLNNQLDTLNQARLRGKYMNVRFVYYNKKGLYFVLHYVDTKSRKSLR